MKFRTKQLVCSIALAGLVFAGINTSWALAQPGGGFTTFFYSDASHSTVVGGTGLSCSTGQVFSWGQQTAYSVGPVHTKCGAWPVPPDPSDGQ